MIKFKSYFEMLCPDKKSKIPSYDSVCGEEFITTYEYDVVDGIKMLVPTGEHDIQSQIDSYKDSQDINNIIARFLNGDTSVINPVHGTYGDFSNVPTTYAELFSHVQKCENVFNNLPADIKERFDNSYSKFWSDFGSDSFNAIFDEYNSKIGKQSAESGGISDSTPAVSSEKGVEDAK